MLFLFGSHLTVGCTALCFSVVHLLRLLSVIIYQEQLKGFFLIYFFLAKVTSQKEFSHNKARLW